MPALAQRHQLYTVKKRDDQVVISFFTRRWAWFIPIVVVVGICIGAVWLLVGLHVNGIIISAAIGGSIGVTASTCFSVSDHLTQYVISIGPDLFSLQKTFCRTPVNRREVYARPLVTDLGFFPDLDKYSSSENGSLRIWVGRRSIELEKHFPIDEAFSLANDLRQVGIEFPRTQRVYSEFDRNFPDGLSYYSF